MFPVAGCSLVELIQGGAGGLSVLRTFRLLRILKLVRFLPALQYQLKVMLRTLDNVPTFLALLVLFIFIFRFICFRDNSTHSVMPKFHLARHVMSCHVLTRHDTFDVSSTSRRACRAALFDKLDTAEMRRASRARRDKRVERVETSVSTQLT